MALQERCDLRMIFFVKQRTRRVKQFTTSGKEPPQRFKDARLLGRIAGDVAGTPQPLYVRMASHHTGGRARHIGEDALKGPAVPPRGATSSPCTAKPTTKPVVRFGLKSRRGNPPGFFLLRGGWLED